MERNRTEAERCCRHFKRRAAKKKRPFMPHQQEAYDAIVSHEGRFGLFMSPGTGKTLVAVRYVNDFELFPALLICRRDDFLTWQEELNLELCPSDQITYLDKSRKLKKIGKSANTIWTFITYDLMKSKKIFNWVISQPWQIVIADESHMIKHAETMRTKKVIKATRHIRQRLALTGSPITNDVGDVFSQCQFYDDGQTFGTNWWRFRNRYYVHNKSSHGWYPRAGSKTLISKKLKECSFYVDEDDVLKLPPKRSVIKSIPMSGIQRRYYNQVLNDWEVQLSETEIIEINQVIAQLAKLRQISSGFMYIPDPDDSKKRRTKWFKSSKLKLLEELLTSPDYLKNKPKIVVWCAFTAEIIRIAELAKQLGIKAVTFYGSDRKLKLNARKTFRDDPEVKLFIGQVDSGVGINELIGADTAVYFSNSTKVVSRQQSMRRIRRKGSEQHTQITYWDLVTERSIDLLLLKNVNSAISTARNILERLKSGERIKNIIKAA